MPRHPLTAAVTVAAAVTGAAALARALRPPARPVPPAAPPAERHPVAGFGTDRVTIVDAAGRAHHHHVLVATTAEQIAQGLAGRTDLAGHAGMLFRLPYPDDLAFWMRNTPLALSIAWFDADGAFIGAADMAPGGPDESRTYRCGQPFAYALEVPRGCLPGLGAGPGSRLHADTPPPPAAGPVA